MKREPDHCQKKYSVEWTIVDYIFAPFVLLFAIPGWIARVFVEFIVLIAVLVFWALSIAFKFWPLILIAYFVFT